VSDPHYHAVLPTVVPGERLMVRQWWPNDCAQLTLEVVLPECVAVLAANRVRCLEELTVTPAEGRWLRDRLTEVLDERPITAFVTALTSGDHAAALYRLARRVVGEAKYPCTATCLPETCAKCDAERVVLAARPGEKVPWGDLR